MDCSNAYPIDYTMNSLCATNALESAYSIDLRKEYQCPSDYPYSKEMPLNTGVTDFEKQRYLQTCEVDNILYPNYCLESSEDKRPQKNFHGYPNVDNLQPNRNNQRFFHHFTKENNISKDENLSVYFEESRKLWENILLNHFRLHPEEKSNIDSEHVESLGNFPKVQNEPQSTSVEMSLDHGRRKIYSVENENFRRGLSSNYIAKKRKASEVDYSPNTEKYFPENLTEVSCRPSKIFCSENHHPVESTLAMKSCHSPRLPIDERVQIPDRSMDLRNIYLQISFDKPKFSSEGILGGKGYPTSNSEVADSTSPLPDTNGEIRTLPETSNVRKFAPKILYDERSQSSKSFSYENTCLQGNCKKYSSYSIQNRFKNICPPSDTINEQQSCLPDKKFRCSSQDSVSNECNVINNVKNSGVNWICDSQLKKRVLEDPLKDASATTSYCKCPKTSFRKLLQETFTRRCCERSQCSHFSHRGHRKLKLDKCNFGNKPSEIVYCDDVKKHFTVPNQAELSVEQQSIFIKSKDEINDTFIKTKNNVNSLSIKSKGDINKLYNKSNSNDIKSEMLDDIIQYNVESEFSDNSTNKNNPTVVKNNSYSMMLDYIALDHSYCKLSEPMEIILD